MSDELVVIPTRINKTASEWAVDATVYSTNKILVTTDVFYPGTDQPRFKFANGVDTWADLDYIPTASVNTIYNSDDTVTDNRTVNGGANDLLFTNFNVLTLEVLNNLFLKSAGGNGLRMNNDSSFRMFTRIGVGDEPAALSRVYAFQNAANGNAFFGISNGSNTAAFRANASGAGAHGFLAEVGGFQAIGCRLSSDDYYALICTAGLGTDAFAAVFNGRLGFFTYEVSGLPSVDNPSIQPDTMGLIIVRDSYGFPTVCFSDGFNWINVWTGLPVERKRKPTFCISDEVSTSGTIYQNDELIGMSKIHKIEVNDIPMSRPYIFDSNLGEIDITYVSGDYVYISYQ